MALVGYARVSSVGQSLDVQVDQAHALRQNLPGENQWSLRHTPPVGGVPDYVREGDTLVVPRLDRLARSTWASRSDR